MSSSVNPANRPRPSLANSFISALSPRNRSAYHHASAATATRNSGSMRPSDGSVNPILPCIVSSGADVDGVACAYHIEAEFNGSGVAYYGYGFNVFARYVSNAITSNDGFMYDASLVGTVHSVPFDNSLLFRELAFIGDSRKIFVPLVWGVELGMIDETAEHISVRDHVTGIQNGQLGASFHVVREHNAPHAVHHGLIAIEFVNIPNNYGLDNTSGKFQDQVTLERASGALTCHIKSKSFTLRDPDLPEHENTFDYNQTSFTYIVPLTDPGTKVSISRNGHLL